VAARAFNRLGYPREDILRDTLPGFATSKLTKTSARALTLAFGVSAQEMDIAPVADADRYRPSQCTERAGL
jgi:NAD+ synthase (glutamine-hydrolysing)